MNKNQHQKEVTHRTILECALKVFSRKGYRDATIKEIHKMAQCNALTIFRHFQDKETLFYCVVDTFCEIDVEPERDLDVELDPEHLEKGLETLSGNYFKALFEHLDILRIFINESTAFPVIRKRAWFICPLLQDHLNRLLSSAGFYCDIYITELFVGYITKLCLEYNTHDRIWDYSNSLLHDFSLKMQRQLNYICSIILLKSSPPNTASGTVSPS